VLSIPALGTPGTIALSLAGAALVLYLIAR